jgi:cytochrome c-type biogenesis protein CcmH/NrfG
MAPSSPTHRGYVKTQTVIFAVFLAFIVGFFAGIVLTIHKSGSGMPVNPDTNAAMEAARQRAGQIADLETLTRKNPKDAEAWTRLGHLYFDDDQFEKAIVAYRKSLEIHPENADIWTDLGVMYRRSRQPEEAIRCFDRAIAIDARHEIARFNKGVVLIHDLNKVQEGLQTWKDLLKINPAVKAPNGQSVEELVRQFSSKKEP